MMSEIEQLSQEVRANPNQFTPWLRIYLTDHSDQIGSGAQPGQAQASRKLADTACFLDGGRILEQGAPEALFADPQEARTKTFLSHVF